MQFIQRLRMGGLLSFPPDMDFFELQPLNVLIGPNASGKSNFIEVLELLRATPTDFRCRNPGRRRRGGVGLERRLPTTGYRSRNRSVSGARLPVKISSVVLRQRSASRYHRRGSRGSDSARSRSVLLLHVPARVRPVINIRVRTPDGTDRI